MVTIFVFWMAGSENNNKRVATKQRMTFSSETVIVSELVTDKMLGKTANDIIVDPVKFTLCMHSYIS